MLDIASLFDDLERIGLGSWRDALAPVIRERLADAAHGDLPRWRETLANLPAADNSAPILDAPAVTVGPPEFEAEIGAALRAALLSLRPWRKGPFRVGDIYIDAEWRSDLKWARLADAITPLAGRRVLDVGCGNGYYALRMLGAGAAAVVGIDPTLVHLAQFQAIRHWLPPLPVRVLPLRLHELPPEAAFFDTVFSMGVLYHQRDPAAHFGQLRGALAAGGELVLETLVVPGDAAEVLHIDGRYARMRNVWCVPTVPKLREWLKPSGFASARVVDVTPTSPAEQRRTDWMPFESLSAALDPADPTRTIEGWPAPRRAIVIAQRGP